MIRAIGNGTTMGRFVVTSAFMENQLVSQRKEKEKYLLKEHLLLADTKGR
jgi:hypothetical protein